MSMASKTPFTLIRRGGSKVAGSSPNSLMGAAFVAMFAPGYFYANDASALLGMDRNVTDTPRRESVIPDDGHRTPDKAYQAMPPALHQGGGAVRAWLPSPSSYPASPAELSSGGASGGGGGGSPASTAPAAPVPAAHRHPVLWRLFSRLRARIEMARQGGSSAFQPSRVASGPPRPAGPGGPQRTPFPSPSRPDTGTAQPSRPEPAQRDAARPVERETQRMPERLALPVGRSTDAPMSMTEFDRRAAMSPDYGQTVGFHVWGRTGGSGAGRFGMGGGRRVGAPHYRQGGFRGRR